MVPRIGEVTLEICDWLYDNERDQRLLSYKGFLYPPIAGAMRVVAEQYEKYKPRRVCGKCGGDGCNECVGRGWKP